MARLREKQQQLEAVIKTGEETIRQLEIRKEEQTKLIEEAINDKKKIVDTEIAAYREVET
jgi:septation ring formation regulator EzrA